MTGEPLPHPAPDAVPTADPAGWLPPRPDTEQPRTDTEQQGVVGREDADAFELIWPTHETDEQYLSDQPSTVMPPPQGPAAEKPGSDTVSADVVLAVQRAIAAIGSDHAAVDEAAVDEVVPLPRLPDRVIGSDASATDSSALRRLIGRLRHR